MLTSADRRRFPILLAVIAALAMAMLFSPVQAQEGSAPDQPTGLEATATHDSVTLTWDDPQDDSITGYVILRRVPGVDPQGQFSELVSDTGTDATTYTDDIVSAETRYHLPHQGHQRARGERALPLVPHQRPRRARRSRQTGQRLRGQRRLSRKRHHPLRGGRGRLGHGQHRNRR